MHEVRPEKAQKVAEIKELLTGNQGIILVNYCGLTVAEDTAMRSALRAAGVKYSVAKNTFIRIAAKEAGVEGLEPFLENNTAVAVSDDNPVDLAKIIVKFAKTHEKLVVKAGFLDGKLLSMEEIHALADLPSREELLSKMLGSMQAPISGLANVLQGTIRNFVYVLDAVREAKEKQSA